MKANILHTFFLSIEKQAVYKNKLVAKLVFAQY